MSAGNNPVRKLQGPGGEAAGIQSTNILDEARKDCGQGPDYAKTGQEDSSGQLPKKNYEWYHECHISRWLSVSEFGDCPKTLAYHRIFGWFPVLKCGEAFLERVLSFQRAVSMASVRSLL